MTERSADLPSQLRATLDDPRAVAKLEELLDDLVALYQVGGVTTARLLDLIAVGLTEGAHAMRTQMLTEAFVPRGPTDRQKYPPQAFKGRRSTWDASARSGDELVEIGPGERFGFALPWADVPMRLDDFFVVQGADEIQIDQITFNYYSYVNQPTPAAAWRAERLADGSIGAGPGRVAWPLVRPLDRTRIELRNVSDRSARFEAFFNVFRFEGY